MAGVGGKKGQRKAKKARYMLNKSGTITAQNAARRQEKHQELLQEQSAQSMRRANMLEDVKHKFHGKTHTELRHIFGTLNINRMTDILNDSYHDAAWYKNRNALTEASAVIVKQVKRGKFFSKRIKKSSKEKSGEVSKVPDESNVGN